MCRPCRTMSSPTLTMAVMSLRRDDAHEPGEHPGGPDAAAQGHQHAASIGAPGPTGRSGDPWYHRRPPCQCASPRIGTRPWCRSCGRRHGSTATSRPTSSPAAGRRAAHPHLRRVGPRRRRRGRRTWPAAASPRATWSACSLPSSIDYAVLYAALLRLGAITSGINPRMGAGEVASILERAAPVLVVVDPEAAAAARRRRRVEVVERAEVASVVGRASHRTAGPSWPRTTRSPWSGPAGPPASRRGRSSTTPTSPPWPGGPTC